MNDYETLEYWDKKYSEPQKEFDWFFADLTHPVLSEFLLGHLEPFKAHGTVIHAGCGNSRLSFQLYRLGFTRIVHFDFSPVVIEQLRKDLQTEFGATPEVAQDLFRVVDATDMSEFPTASADLVFEKSLLDALCCGTELGEKYELELFRVLRPGGTAIILSYSIARKLNFPLRRWEVQYHELLLQSKPRIVGAPPVYHHALICTKK